MSRVYGHPEDCNFYSLFTIWLLIATILWLVFKYLMHSTYVSNTCLTHAHTFCVYIQGIHKRMVRFQK
jgi:hypothetical protein